MCHMGSDSTSRPSPLNPARGLGSAVSSPSGFGRSSAAKRVLVNLNSHLRHSVHVYFAFLVHYWRFSQVIIAINRKKKCTSPKKVGWPRPAQPNRLRCQWQCELQIYQQGCSGKFWFGGNGFRDLGPSNREACALRTACSRAGVGAGGGRHVPLRGSTGVTPGKFFEIFDAKSRVWRQFGAENKLIESQPNEYYVIYRNASVLAFHLWPTIFAGAPFRFQNICRNGVPPRSRTTTPLFARLPWLKTDTEHFNVIWLSFLFISIICKLTEYQKSTEAQQAGRLVKKRTKCKTSKHNTD